MRLKKKEREERKSEKKRKGILLLFSSIVALFVMPQAFFFPVGVTYVVVGIVMALLRGAFDLPSPLTTAGHPASYSEEDTP